MSGYDDWLGQEIPEHVMEEAAHWMAALDSNECSAADRVAFARWLSADPLHQGGFEELSEVWARLRTLSDVEDLKDQPDVIPFPLTPVDREFQEEQRPPARAEWSTLAASVLVVFGVVLHVVFGTPSDLHETNTGEIQTIALTDGSRIEMNARSSIEVQMDDNRREIRLSNGEAVFSVEKDERPFVVRTELATVSAVGTRFSVRADSNVVEVAVIDGLVSVAPSNSSTALTEYESDLLVRFSDEIALLGAGQRIEVTRESQRYEVVSLAALDQELSWRRGEVVFDQTPLVAALQELRRYHDVSILVGDPILNSLRISGRYSTTDANDFLDSLRDNYGIVGDRSAGNAIILRKN